MYNKQNQFSITFFYNNIRVMFIQYCHHEKLAINWLQKKGIKWDTANVYHRKTRKFLKQLKNL